MSVIKPAPQTHIITTDCPSRPGTVDVVTRFLFKQGFYINEIHSFVDTNENHFLYVSGGNLILLTFPILLKRKDHKLLEVVK